MDHYDDLPEHLKTNFSAQEFADVLAAQTQRHRRDPNKALDETLQIAQNRYDWNHAAFQSSRDW